MCFFCVINCASFQVLDTIVSHFPWPCSQKDHVLSFFIFESLSIKAIDFESKKESFAIANANWNPARPYGTRIYFLKYLKGTINIPKFSPFSFPKCLWWILWARLKPFAYQLLAFLNNLKRWCIKISCTRKYAMP